MLQEKQYYAFISYKREDEAWARWLAKKIENYNLPTTLNGKELPKSLRPVFRDTDELSAGNLPKQIYDALSISKNLIVICSPCSAQSEWVNKEIQDFISIKGGKTDNIFPFIIDGTPNSKVKDIECFPQTLRSLPGNEERLGGNINEQGGRDAAVVKVISGMLGVSFDSLWHKYEREQRRLRLIYGGIIILFALLISALFVYGVRFYDKKVENYCKSGIKVNDGLFNTQRQLLDYQNNSWLLSKDTRTLLKQRIYEVDYSYNISPFPLIYTYPLNAWRVDQINFNRDETQIVVATGAKETSGIWNYKEDEFKNFNTYASSVDYIGNNTNIITCGLNVSKYSGDNKKLDEYEIEGHSMIVSPSGNTFVTQYYKEVTLYNSVNGCKIYSKVFDKDIFCYSYSNTGDILAVVTADSCLHFLDSETGEMLAQHKLKVPIISISNAKDKNTFFVATQEDSIRINALSMDSLRLDRVLFSVPNSASSMSQLSYSGRDILAFTNGRYLVLYNIETGEIIPTDIYYFHKAEIGALAVSPSGSQICYSINGNLYINQIKEKSKRKIFPIQHYGFSHVIGPTTARLCPNDSTIVMAVIHNDSLSSVAQYDLYSGERLSKYIKSKKNIWKVLPMQNRNHVAVAFDETNSWDVVDFTTTQFVKRFIAQRDTLSVFSNLMLSANKKYLLARYVVNFGVLNNYMTCIFSPTNYECIDSVYMFSRPLQDGENFYDNHAIFTYPRRKFKFSTEYISLSEEIEISDKDKIASVNYGKLTILNLKDCTQETIALKPLVVGDATRYKLLGFKQDYALLFNNSHFIILNTHSKEVVLLRQSTNNECITSATFFNNQLRVLVTTDKALYVFDILDFIDLCDDWNRKLAS